MSIQHHRPHLSKIGKTNKIKNEEDIWKWDPRQCSSYLSMFLTTIIQDIMIEIIELKILSTKNKVKIDLKI